MGRFPSLDCIPLNYYFPFHPKYLVVSPLSIIMHQVWINWHLVRLKAFLLATLLPKRGIVYTSHPPAVTSLAEMSLSLKHNHSSNPPPNPLLLPLPVHHPCSTANKCCTFNRATA